MKHKLSVLFSALCSCSIVACILFATGCKENNPPDPGNNEPSLYGNVSRPAWTAPAEYDYTSSLTALISVDLTIQYPDSAQGHTIKDADMLGAFSGSKCLGVAVPDSASGMFFLYVASPSSEETQSVTLRYYSAQYKNLFEAKNAFVYKNDDHLGTPASPFKPTFTLVE